MTPASSMHQILKMSLAEAMCVPLSIHHVSSRGVQFGMHMGTAVFRPVFDKHVVNHDKVCSSLMPTCPGSRCKC